MFQLHSTFQKNFFTIGIKNGAQIIKTYTVSVFDIMQYSEKDMITFLSNLIKENIFEFWLYSVLYPFIQKVEKYMNICYQLTICKDDTTVSIFLGVSTTKFC